MLVTGPHMHTLGVLSDPPRTAACWELGWTVKPGERTELQRAWGRQRTASQWGLISPQPGLLVGKLTRAWSTVDLPGHLTGSPNATLCLRPPAHILPAAVSDAGRASGIAQQLPIQGGCCPQAVPTRKSIFIMSPGARLGPKSRSKLDIPRSLYHFKRFLFYKRTWN